MIHIVQSSFFPQKDLVPDQAKSMAPACLPAYLIFMMIRYNDMTLNSNELTALFDMTEEFVTDAVKQKTKAKKEVQKIKNYVSGNFIYAVC
jgi:hypothetical protein